MEVQVIMITQRSACCCSVPCSIQDTLLLQHLSFSGLIIYSLKCLCLWSLSSEWEWEQTAFYPLLYLQCSVQELAHSNCSGNIFLNQRNIIIWIPRKRKPCKTLGEKVICQQSFQKQLATGWLWSHCCCRLPAQYSVLCMLCSPEPEGPATERQPQSLQWEKAARIH